MTDTTEKLEANKKLARDYIDQAFNQHNPDKARHGPARAVAGGGDQRG